ncbi:MAG: cell division protein FtsQ/DivIB [Candidatus Omnitrophica bacterium]|nr:cell division protein FtsQ/DivIB [Candidatus Omnitrophota bacterium]
MARRGGSRRTKKKVYSENFINEKMFLGKVVLITAVILGLLIGASFVIRYYFCNSEIFNIKEISVNKDLNNVFEFDANKLNELYLGRNIFTINLNQAEIFLKNNFPQFKEVEVRKIFPNIMELNVVSRIPIAKIDFGDIIIDEEGVVLAVGESTENLITIKGLKFFLNMPEVGKKIDSKVLNRALLLLRGLKREIEMETTSVDFVDVSDRNNVVLNIAAVEVKIGKNDFVRKIDALKEILNDPNMNVRDLRYIDLRFEDAVISFK